VLLAEELLLLLLDPKPGKMANPAWDLGVGSALLTELAWGGHVELAPGTKWRTRLSLGATDVVRPGASTPTDSVLVDAIDLIAATERNPPQVVEHLGRELHRSLLERLEAERIIRPQTETCGGWPGGCPTSGPSLTAIIGPTALMSLTCVVMWRRPSLEVSLPTSGRPLSP
jgi:hypothetical protein